MTCPHSLISNKYLNILEFTNSYVLHRVIVISKRTKNKIKNGIQILDRKSNMLTGHSAVPGQSGPYVGQSGDTVSSAPNRRAIGKTIGKTPMQSGGTHARIESRIWAWRR
jgi:hypothetical protein